MYQKYKYIKIYAVYIIYFSFYKRKMYCPTSRKVNDFIREFKESSKMFSKNLCDKIFKNSYLILTIGHINAHSHRL